MAHNNSLVGSTVTITGGTGSFGSNMALRLLQLDVAEVRIFSRDEAKQDQMRHEIKDDRMRYFIGDTRDKDSIDRATRGAAFVFHAAAMKQVPSSEFFPMEAMKTNVIGSANVMQAAIENGVRSLVCLSTDKAVYPINAMGMTKALMERTAQAICRGAPQDDTTISITRYGNVMASRGSVIPLFISQIKSGGPITVTDPNMTRFLMSLEESVQLVEYAFVNAQPGDLFVKKAPACTIETLAKALLELFGASKTEIKTIGFRHGEKLYETLLGSEEMAYSKDLGDYFRVPMDSRDLDYSDYFDRGSGEQFDQVSYNSHNARRLGVEETKQLLLSLPTIRQELNR